MTKRTWLKKIVVACLLRFEEVFFNVLCEKELVPYLSLMSKH